jgi:ribosomal protein L37AE/L43A
MEWWTFMAYMATGTFDPTGWSGIERNRYEPPDPAEKWLIEIVYETVAAETRCTRCGTPLDRPRVRAGIWPVRVSTRCRGGARHRHRANVLRTSDGLSLAPLITA